MEVDCAGLRRCPGIIRRQSIGGGSLKKHPLPASRRSSEIPRRDFSRNNLYFYAALRGVY